MRTTRAMRAAVVGVSLGAAAVAAAATQGGAAKEPHFPCYGVITTDRTNLRAGHSLNYETVFRLDRGARVTVTGLEKGWYSIEAPEDAPCYVSTKYLADRKVICGRLNVRAKASPKATVLCQLDRGDTVEEIEKNSEWTTIRAPDCVELWVSAELISLVGEEEEEEEEPPAAATPGRAAASPAAPARTTAGPLAAAVPPPPAEAIPAAPGPTGVPCRREGKIVSSEEMGVSGAPYCLVQGLFMPSVVCLIDSRTVKLDHYRGDRVRIWGYELSRHISGVPVVDVRRLEVE